MKYEENGAKLGILWIKTVCSAQLGIAISDYSSNFAAKYFQSVIRRNKSIMPTTRKRYTAIRRKSVVHKRIIKKNKKIGYQKVIEE